MNLAIIEYSILAAIVLLISALVGSFLKMGPRIISLTQRFTAGIVFAAVATQLLPKILEVHSPIHIAIGFCLGVMAKSLCSLEPAIVKIN